jgi:hypothetical protein
VGQLDTLKLLLASKLSLFNLQLLLLDLDVRHVLLLFALNIRLLDLQLLLLHLNDRVLLRLLSLLLGSLGLALSYETGRDFSDHPAHLKLKLLRQVSIGSGQRHTQRLLNTLPV